MRNLKIGKKLLVAFGSVMIVFIVCIIYAIVSLNSISNNYDFFYNQSHQVMVAQLDMQRSFQSGVKNIVLSFTTDNQQDVENSIEQAESDMDALKDGLVILKEKFTGDQAQLDDFEAKMTESITFREQIFELSRANRNAEAVKIYNEKYAPLLVEAQNYLKAIGVEVTDRADGVYTDSARSQSIALVLMIALGIVGVLLILFYSVYITRSISRPVKELEDAAKQMSVGGLKVDISYESKDELGSLAESMRTTIKGISNIVEDIGYLLGEMGDGNFRVTSRIEDKYLGDYAPILVAVTGINHKLSSTLSQINQAADQVSVGADQVSGGSQGLSQGATEQASAVEELAATINEISSQVKSTAANAEDANIKTREAGQRVGLCNEQMDGMIQAMKEISGTSGEIGKIIKTIEDIAFQTNILALNAAVEAARAGAAGKGFAVVADEVRNLASKSAEASKNTASLIESSIRAVENGTKLANETAHSLLSVVESTESVTSTVEKISGATNIQANSIIQVTQGVDQISSVVQTNSATAEESAAASEELSGQAQMLKGLINQFRLREEDAGTMSFQQARPVSKPSKPSMGAVNLGAIDLSSLEDQDAGSASDEFYDFNVGGKY